MSLFGAMLSGVSALSSHTQSMAAISDNISNVNTVGYHQTTTRFQTLVTEAATSTHYTPGGVRPSPLALVDKQGLLQGSSSTTDIALEGRGLFVVTKSATPTSTDERFFTRAGSFRPDSNGNLVNAAGYYLQGTPRASNGTLPANVSSALTSLSTVNINAVGSTAQATTSVAIKANLKASQANTTWASGYTNGNLANGTMSADFARDMQIFDSLGTAHTLTLGFLKTTAANQWQMEAYIQPGTDLNAASHATGNATGRVVMRGLVAFNSNGSLDITTTSLVDQGGTAITKSASTGNLTGAVVTWTNGASAQNVAFNFGAANSTSNLTQFDGASALFGTTINGSIYGALAGVEVSKTGVVTSKFDNGVNIDIFRLPIADFPNLNGLEGSSGNLYSQSTISGTLTLKDATQSGAGSVIASALEASTVDLAEEFSNMIVTQRAYSASTRIITTTDEMLNELVNIKR